MAITILTDSTSDILPEEAARRGIGLVSLNVAFGEEVCRDNLDITHDAFYDKLAQAQEKYHFLRVETHSVGAVIGAHVGPGAIVVAYLEKA